MWNMWCLYSLYSGGGQDTKPCQGWNAGCKVYLKQWYIKTSNKTHTKVKCVFMTRVTETFGVDSSWPTSRATPTLAVSSSSLCASTGLYGWKSASTQTQPLPFHVQSSALHRANKSLAKVGFRVKQRGARPLMSLACVRCFQLFTYRRSRMRFYCQHQNSALIFTNAGGRAPVRPLPRSRERWPGDRGASRTKRTKKLTLFSKQQLQTQHAKGAPSLILRPDQPRVAGSIILLLWSAAKVMLHG